MDQAEQAVSVQDRIAALYTEPEKKPEQAAQEQIPDADPEQAPEPAVEGADAPDTPEAPAEEVDESILTPEQLAAYKVRIQVDGAEKEVTLEEARLGYMRQEDYTRKTQEISKLKAEIPEQVKGEVSKEREKYEHNVKIFHQAYMQLAGEELNNVNWNQLVEKDPAEFLKLSHRAQQINRTIEGARKELERLDAAKQEEEQKYLAQAIPQAVETLKAKIPNWSNELYQKVLESGVENYGFKPEEVSNVIDPRMIQVLHEARMWRDAQTNKSILDKKVAEVPKVLKPGSQQSKTVVKAEREAELKANIRKSGGRSEDVIALLMQRQRR